MEKQILALLAVSGKMKSSDIAMAMRLDDWDAGAILLRLASKGRIKSHQNLFTGAESFSLA